MGIHNCPIGGDAGAGEWWWLREGSIPLRFQGGVTAPINKSPRSSVAQTGWFVKSNKNKVRYADIYKEATRPFTNHPVCATEERGLFIEAQPPLLENGGECAHFKSCHRFRNCFARSHQKSEVYAHYNHSIRNLEQF